LRFREVRVEKEKGFEDFRRELKEIREKLRELNKRGR
jgi:hypothetical protein